MKFDHQRSHSPELEFGILCTSQLLLFFHSLIFTTGSHRSPHNSANRSFLSCYWIFTITIVATFSGNFMAYMTATKLRLPIKNLHELATKSDYQAAIPGGGATQQIFQVHLVHIS